MKKLLAATAVAFLSAASAQAATFVFVPGSDDLAPGETTFASFNNAAEDGIVTGSNFVFLTGTSSQGAMPAAGDGTRYLSVLANGTANINLGAVSAFSADFGSLDQYNTLTLTFQDGTTQSFTGDVLNGAFPANGDQQSPTTNGRLQFRADAGQTITGVSFASSQNSFEIDDLAVSAVPEPATWAMMIGGFGLVGGAMRRRRSVGTTVTA
ncbi:hypothetical protein GGR88_002424 [Sphingomonas jejuensis]|uniref:Ice-binding protein C-terminal domain-containing protein n=1 Tax=Sphingomonas jejuensis TaxID=904715 RepID=A0ABX0XQF5_9SPHN|nr:PEPxxWA-CTERM sorting domain-containing protein [Sphingomonas jejuensis]NJC34910.1 hypothetical protein [Sphingomonas jejuensis]